jgi:hypothetical protein
MELRDAVIDVGEEDHVLLEVQTGIDFQRGESSIH